MRPEVDLSRRTLLGVIGAGTVGAVGYGVSQRPADPVETTSPEPGTWPSRGYDAANTAANPHAAVGPDPTVDWQTPGSGWTVIVGLEHVFVSENDRLVAFDRASGRVAWERPVRDFPYILHVRRGTLYYSDKEEVPRVRALDARTGEEQWRTRYAPWDALLADEALVLTDGGSIRAVEYETGQTRWQWERRGHADIAAADGHLYGQNGHLTKHAVQDVLDVRTDSAPELAWQVDRTPHTSEDLAVGGGRVVTGTMLRSRQNRTESPGTPFPSGATPSPPEPDPPVPALAAHDVETGERAWGTFWSDEVPLEAETRYGVELLAVAHGRVYASLTVAANPGEPSIRQRPTLFAYSLDDGTHEWTAELPRQRSDDSGATALCATADHVLVANQPAAEPDNYPGHAPTARALAADDGTERWRVELPDDSYAMAVADDTVFAATNGPTVAIR